MMNFDYEDKSSVDICNMIITLFGDVDDLRYSPLFT